ncbi:TonB-dependent receptor [Sphingomonas sp. S1-29]|uniref:TonB-dependent receptor n=1 Tax=Sphingomonas sp. S1-29 TaxID=2991074 RepID=UPI002240A8AA|nr:TonB-dependent receptor [Sphingomonas sp. S1-29]UZK70290.1 TonB-dependent receptor [Sphingomonas sp. S1-29]
MRITVTMSTAALRSSASAIAMALFGVAMPQGALAQEAPPAAGVADPAERQDEAAATDEIVVTGLRQSLASAQAIKREADQFVDSITAQDIGRLPDVNVAEALQRVSGVQITRNRGEGSGIAVRGLTQVRTELNGRDIFSASGGRGLSFEEVGSELLAGVDVYKNPAADLVEGGLSGTVNLRTRLPFDQTGQLIAVTGGVTYYDLIEKSGQQLSGLYSNRWDTGIGEIGFLANVGYQTTSFREDLVVTEPFYQHGPAAPGVQTPINGFENQTVLLPHGGGFSTAYGDRERLSGAVALQWRPTAGLEFYAQYFRADYKFNEAGNSFFAYGADAPPSPDRPFTVDDNGIVRTGYLSNPGTDSVNFGTVRDTSTTDISGGVRWDVTSNLLLTVDYQHIDSTVEQTTMNLTASALNPRTSVPGSGQSYDLFVDISGDVPVFQSTTPGYFGNLANYGMTAILPYGEKNDAAADALRADLTWDFGDDGFIRDVRVGGRYTEKSAINRNTTYGTWSAIGQSCANWSGDCTRLSEFPQFAQPGPFQADLLRGSARNTVFGPVWQFADNLVTNPQAAFDAVRQATGQEIGFRDYESPDAFLGTINEKTYAAYVRVGFGGELGTVRFDGNVGVRAVRTETLASGRRLLTYRDPAATGGVGTNVPNIIIDEDFSGGRNFDRYLPSANIKVNLTEELILRGAFSQNFARPSFAQLNPQFNLQPSYTDAGEVRALVPNVATPGTPYDPVTNPYVGTGTALGDPNLKPEEATSYDLALEWYFDNVGFVYVTGFYKNLKNLLVERAAAPVFEQLPGVGNVRFNVRRWVNESEGYVRGFEVGGQKFFDFLPAPFDGLGVQANYTFADSDAGVTAAGDINSTTEISVPLVNLSKHSYNLVALYDKNGLNMRAAYNWRSSFLEGTANTGTQNLPIFGEAYGTLDASITYDVTSQFAITVDAQNLLDTAFKSYQIFDDRPRDYGINDRRFSVRARVKF